MRISLIIFQVLFVNMCFGQIEICDNAIDDDNDGLIDINDPDCMCPETVPSGLIPNPSFEGMTCCPSSEAELDCADSWIQASAATSDYLHTCGTFTYPTWMNNNYRTPTPYPDGQGWVGFRNGKPGNPQFKEYIGACLNATMEVGKTYRIDFYLGFPRSSTFDGINMTFYGHEDCSSIPFGNGLNNIGCPLNTPGWTLLNAEYIEGRNEWLNIVIEFTADRPYNVFVLGPGCDQHPDFNGEPYYFVDRLALAEANEFDVPFAEIIGDVCDDNLSLIAPTGNNYTYQWYKDGIALIGEVSSDIDIPVEPASEGVYLVVFGVGTTCFYSEEFDLKVPKPLTNIEASICEGESYEILGQNLTVTDVYEYFLFSALGCDSIVVVDLTVHETPNINIQESLCEGDIYQVGTTQLTTSGIHTVVLTTAVGCDSTVIVDLTVNTEAKEEITPRICQGEMYSVGGTNYTMTGTYEIPLTTSNGCDSLITLRLIVLDATEDFIEKSICEGESYDIAGQSLTVADTYVYMLESRVGCDSVITLDLLVVEHTSSDIEDVICVGETYTILNQEITEPGSYMLTTTNVGGCDSNILLELNVVDRTGGIELDEEIEISLGESVTITPAFIDPVFDQTEWTVSNNTEIEVNGYDATLRPLSATALTLTGVDEYGCTESETIDIRINRNIGIYAPNIFSPNGDGTNDNWKIWVTKSIENLKSLQVYDRWGNLVYEEANVSDVNNITGWDGTFEGARSSTGVYVYHVVYTALDGVDEELVGDVTLIR